MARASFDIMTSMARLSLLTPLGRIIMAALCHYIFALWFFLSSIFFYLSFSSSPNPSRRRLDVYHTSTHSVALVRI